MADKFAVFNVWDGHPGLWRLKPGGYYELLWHMQSVDDREPYDRLCEALNRKPPTVAEMPLTVMGMPVILSAAVPDGTIVIVSNGMKVTIENLKESMGK